MNDIDDKFNNAQTPLLTIAKLNKWYGNFHVLKDINLQIAAGARVVICGPSGSGKSTLIRCINRLEDYQEGEIYLNGELLKDSTRQTRNLRRRVGMVFQQFNLFPHLSILENLTLAPIHVNKLSPAQARQKAFHYLERVGILEQAHKYPRQISGGQQQRVAIARSLCMDCEVLLFDEPTSALDPEMIQEVLNVMIELAESSKITMICVTHEMGFARSVADIILFMDKGEILERARPEDFFKSPKNPRSREFLAQILH